MDISSGSLRSLLTQNEGREGLFEKARQVRAKYFGNEVFAYGFNYFSTHCMNRCGFCGFRHDNTQAYRYRNSPSRVIGDAQRLAETGVHLIDLTMGEDPYYIYHPERLADLIYGVKQTTGLPVMVSPGVVRNEHLELLRQAGAVWIALYQETFNRDAFMHLRMGQDYDRRLELKLEAVRAGLLVEEGILTGWGDSITEAFQSVQQMQQAHPSQVRVMTLVPQDGTPLEGLAPLDSERELLLIAAMRLLYPDKLIPATLDVEGLDGLERRLNAGANVITSIIPPQSGLAGVVHKDDVDSGGRSLPQLLPIIEKAGLKLASQASYEDWLQAAIAEQERGLSSESDAAGLEFSDDLAEVV
jgi:methylornithine synthase